MSGARLPVAGRRPRRIKNRDLSRMVGTGDDRLVICVATNLPPEEVAALDALAGAAGETRSEYIRRAVLARMNATSARGLEDIMLEEFGPA